jgi:hypothetical protein
VESYGALTARREPSDLYFQFIRAKAVQQRTSNGKIHAVASPVRSKPFVNAALQKVKVIGRIKFALTGWYSITS